MGVHGIAARWHYAVLGQTWRGYDSWRCLIVYGKRMEIRSAAINISGRRRGGFDVLGSL